jgi:hypothetical protein
MIMKILIYTALTLMLGIAMALTSPVKAQNKLPVIRSGIPAISIRDGKALSEKSWQLNPKSKPDVYFVQAPEGKRKVTFITDQDSISFITVYGKSYDFIILLNGKDSCLTRITANYEGIVKAEKSKGTHGGAADTIPFFMRDSRIYFKGKLNGRLPFDIMFDLGAGITCLNIKSVPNAGVKFDGKISVRNTSGTNDEPMSSTNTLEIAGLKWNKVPLVQVRNLDKTDDMIIGNSLFRDKVIEIDYDHKIMIITDSLLEKPAGYSAHDISFDQHRPLFEMDVKVGQRYYPFHFLFDTGRDGTMLIGEDFTGRYGLWDQFHSIMTFGSKKIVVIPEVRIGSRTFRNILTNANDPGHPNGKQSLMGNEVLNQFNLILDNRQGIIYLKPNTLQNENYATYGEFKVQAAIVISSIVLFLALAIFGVRRWIKSRKKTRSLNK